MGDTKEEKLQVESMAENTAKRIKKGRKAASTVNMEWAAKQELMEPTAVCLVLILVLLVLECLVPILVLLEPLALTPVLILALLVLILLVLVSNLPLIGKIWKEKECAIFSAHFLNNLFICQTIKNLPKNLFGSKNRNLLHKCIR